LVDAGVPDSPGAEWFTTSPEHIAKWFAQFENVVAELGPNRAEQIVGRESR